MFQNSLLNFTLFAVVCQIGRVLSELPSNISKCKPNNGICLGNIATQLIQKSDQYPDLNVPLLNPYKPENPWIVQTRSPILPIKFEGKSSNMSIYGLNQIEITELQGLEVNPSNTITLRGRAFVPTLIIDTGLTTTGKVFLVGFKTGGHANAKMHNVEVLLTINGYIVQRNGKNYVEIRNVQPRLKIGDFSVKSNCQNISPFINRMIDEAINLNWGLLQKALEPYLNKYIGEIITSVISPIFRKISIEDFSQ